MKTPLQKQPSLPDRVASVLRDEIRNRHQPGDRLPTIRQFADRFAVSINTIHQALAVLRREGAVEGWAGRGTFVARPDHPKAVAVATLTYPGQPPNSFQMRLFLSVAKLFRRQGYRCRSYIAPAEVGPQAWDELIEDASAGRIAGAAFVAMNPDTVPLPLAENNVPYLHCDGSNGSVELDDVELVRRGVAHLLARGCRRIGLMQWTGNMLHERETTEAFRSVLAGHGLPVCEDWIRPLVPPEVPGAGWEQFRELWSARAEKPDGLLVTDDILFRDVALAILNSKINVPEQLQVVTHANKGSGLTYPFPVSALEVDLEEWAEAIVQRLIKLMNHQPVSPSIQYIRARLIPAGENPAGQVLTVAQSGLNLETSTK